MDKKTVQKATVKRRPMTGFPSSVPLEILSPMITPAIVDLAQAHLKLTPEKLALLLVRLINPAHIFQEKQECLLRGVSAKTLRDLKQRKEIPMVLPT